MSAILPIADQNGLSLLNQRSGPAHLPGRAHSSREFRGGSAIPYTPLSAGISDTCADRFPAMWNDGDVGLPKRHLGADEVEILHLRTHGKALVGPVLVLLVTAVLVGVAVAAAPPEWQPWANWALFGLGAVVVIGWAALPYLRWLTTTYTLTDRRIITRRGIINKTGHDLPLTRINNVAYERDLLDRILGCGTLQLTTAAEAPLYLHDIPDVERVHVVMTELLFGDDARAVRPPDADE